MARGDADIFPSQGLRRTDGVPILEGAKASPSYRLYVVYSSRFGGNVHAGNVFERFWRGDDVGRPGHARIVFGMDGTLA